nr:zinc ribbon domain-containing protein [Desulfobulbaceae bacterium]
MSIDACLKYADEEHICPHCNTKLSCCNTPPMHVGDGLGWGTDIFFVCLNNNCSLYVNGWKHVEEQYGKVSSFRYMKLPNEEKGSPMMVGSPIAFTGSIVDFEALKKKSTRYQTEKTAIEKLKTCVQEKNLEPVLFLITDEDSNLEERRKACQLLEEICDISCIDPIRNHKFRHTEIQQIANIGISKMLKKTFQKECPHCAEIIKAQAAICKHCGK